MKKVLVTGATGFIGKYVVAELLRNNCAVIATAMDAPQKACELWKNEVEYKQFNLDQFSQTVNYHQYFNQPEAIIHLAWEGLPNYKSLFHYEINLPRHYAFIKNMVSNGLKDVTVAGTCFEYGMQEGCLNENMPSMPANAYALAKDTLRKYLEQLQTVLPFSFKWARLFYMYGEGQNPKSLFSQLDKALECGEQTFNMSGGEQVRDYLPVTKVAEYIVKIALQEKVTGIINCCSGIPVTVKKLVQNYLKEKNKNILLNLGFYLYPDYEPMKFWGDNTKLKMIL